MRGPIRLDGRALGPEVIEAQVLAEVEGEERGEDRALHRRRLGPAACARAATLMVLRGAQGVTGPGVGCTKPPAPALVPPSNLPQTVRGLDTGGADTAEQGPSSDGLLGCLQHLDQ
jgi:hypothetical protein